ncbi:hypothetical protein ACLIYP_02105 [Streptomyces nanhaiensis]|uniref:hypothetical protein n=1 Tax=Streptomyces nanhaiensis TaxID=679319 RepID=UPI00399CC6A6
MKRSEEISIRVRARPRFEEALRTAREVKVQVPHPHCRVTLTVYEMKRLGRDAAELTVLADHLPGRPWCGRPGGVRIAMPGHRP